MGGRKGERERKSEILPESLLSLNGSLTSLVPMILSLTYSSTECEQCSTHTRQHVMVKRSDCTCAHMSHVLLALHKGPSKANTETSIHYVGRMK